MPKQAKTITDAVREICLHFPQAEEIMSHGSPNFRISGGKVFATYAVNHHGDGRVALWLRTPRGHQELYVEAEPEYFFVPPYVGPAGWLGVTLDKGLDWQRIAGLVHDAFMEVAPKKIAQAVGPVPSITPPTAALDPAEFDPFQRPQAQARLREIGALCSAYPEAEATTQFGNPCFKAGKKSFCTLYFRGGRLHLSAWAGTEQQATLTFDPRYKIPMYTGHNGWIELDIEEDMLPGEAQSLIDASYRHFALKRMLKALDQKTST